MHYPDKNFVATRFVAFQTLNHVSLLIIFSCCHQPSSTIQYIQPKKKSSPLFFEIFLVFRFRLKLMSCVLWRNFIFNIALTTFCGESFRNGFLLHLYILFNILLSNQITMYFLQRKTMVEEGAFSSHGVWGREMNSNGSLQQ